MHYKIMKTDCMMLTTFFGDRLVTQNVDALHYKARSMRVTELHGSAHRVVCLSCRSKILRNTMQEHIKALNPKWHAQSLEMAPDGDVSLTTEQVKGFKVRILGMLISYCCTCIHIWLS